MGERRQRVLGVAPSTACVASSPEENSAYSVGGDVFQLLGEVLNSSTRAVLVYDDFSGEFSDPDLCALAAVMGGNTSILSVNLCGVDVGDSALSLLADALVGSRVRVIDLSNTYLADEAGASLVALASCNPNLRTVIVDDTLIPEEIMDEIDLACQYNETLGDPEEPAPIDPARERFCPRHFFGCCPDGDYCVLSHGPAVAAGRPSPRAAGLSSRPLELPQAPCEGASWAAEDRPQFRPRLRTRRRGGRPGGAGGGGAWLWWAVPAAAVVLASAAVAGVALATALR